MEAVGGDHGRALFVLPIRHVDPTDWIDSNYLLAMYKTFQLFVAVLIALAVMLPRLSSAAEIWVSPTGSDANPGTKSQPLRSPGFALRKARELRRLKDLSTSDGVEVVFSGGVYALSKTLDVRPEDSGTEASPTVFRAAEGETPVLSGGVQVSGWRKLVEAVPGIPSEAVGHVWVADVPRFHGRRLLFRQLWVEDGKAIRARSPNVDKMERLTLWDREKQVAGFPGYMVRSLIDSDHLELNLLQQWEIANLRIKSIEIPGQDARVAFHDPESEIEFEHPWPQPVMEPKGAPFFLTGAIEFLDTPGEWHCDQELGKVYYWPRQGEDPESATIVVPALETLVRVSGSADRPVVFVRFENIAFEHTTWLRPSLQGHVPLQAGMYLTEAYKLRPKGTPDWRSLENQAWIGRPPGAVEVEWAHGVKFSRCSFQRLASAGLDVVSGMHSGTIEGCTFRSIGGNGMQIGGFQTGSIETHLPFDPRDERVSCKNLRIANNLVTDCGNEDWGCVGICAGYVTDSVIEHNEVFDQPYTGISVGWGWTRTKNVMKNNRVVANHIHHVATRLADCAAIYTLSAQPGTVIADNYVHDITMSPYVHSADHWFYLYLDEGSSNITVKNNWCPAEKFLANANGPGNVWENNGPQVSEEIKKSAGLQQEFRDLMLEKE